MCDLKTFVEAMARKGYIFKSTKRIEVSQLNSRKKLDIFICVDLKGYYHVGFVSEQKSRFILLHVKTILELEDKIVQLENHNNKYKHIFIKEAICSKAKQELINRGWKVYNDFM